MGFMSKKNGNSLKKSSYNDAAVTILTSACHFNGKLYCKGSSRIGGKIEGEILSEGLLIIEEEANINASIKAEEVIIQGKVNGKLEAKIRVELTESSSYEGDIFTPNLIVREGAKFNGRSSMAHTQLEKLPEPDLLHNVDKFAKKNITLKEETLRKFPEKTTDKAGNIVL